MSTDLQGHKIGFVGLGNMGAPMARHLHAAGAEVCVWNRSEGPLAAVQADGLRTADSLKALAEDVGDGIICVNLTTPDVVEKNCLRRRWPGGRFARGRVDH